MIPLHHHYHHFCSVYQREYELMIPSRQKKKTTKRREKGPRRSRAQKSFRDNPCTFSPSSSSKQLRYPASTVQARKPRGSLFLRGGHVSPSWERCRPSARHQPTTHTPYNAYVDGFPFIKIALIKYSRRHCSVVTGSDSCRTSKKTREDERSLRVAPIGLYHSPFPPVVPLFLLAMYSSRPLG